MFPVVEFLVLLGLLGVLGVLFHTCVVGAQRIDEPLIVEEEESVPVISFFPIIK